jgi:hypothetical protein
MGNKEIEDRLPGLRLSVRASAITGLTTGCELGEIVLRCEIRDRQVWKAAVEKLNGLKLFSTVHEEVVSALSEELDTVEDQLLAANARVTELEKLLAGERAELRRFYAVCEQLGIDLGLS